MLGANKMKMQVSIKIGYGNDQCKCLTNDSCSAERRVQGHNAYQLDFGVAGLVLTITRPAVTTTTTIISVAGTLDDSDIFIHKACVDDGSAWMTDHEECAEGMGQTCPEGEVHVSMEGECCKKSMFKPGPSEGAQGTDECPAGCVHANDKDECKLAEGEAGWHMVTKCDCLERILAKSHPDQWKNWHCRHCGYTF